MTIKLNPVKVALLSTGLMFATTVAYAQKVEVGSNISLNLGQDVKAAHASHGELGLDGRDAKASAEVGDGLRVGDSKFESHVHGAVSAPAAFVAGVLAN